MMTSLERSGKPPSQRQLRAGELIRQCLSEILSRHEVRDPDVEGKIITVSEVRVSPDLRTAVAFVMPLGGVDEQKVLVGLNRSAKWISGQVARKVTLKYAPRVKFSLDESFDQASTINNILHSDRVVRDLGSDDGSDTGDN